MEHASESKSQRPFHLNVVDTCPSVARIYAQNDERIGDVVLHGEFSDTYYRDTMAEIDGLLRARKGDIRQDHPDTHKIIGSFLDMASTKLEDMKPRDAQRGSQVIDWL